MNDTAAEHLSDDIEAMRALLVDMMRQRDEASRQRDEALRQRDEASRQRDQWKLRHDQKELDRLRLEVKLLQLLRRVYGRKADTLSRPEDLGPLQFDFANQIEALPAPEVEEVADQDKPVDLREVDLPTVRKIRKGRRDLAEFDHLPTITKTRDLPAEQKPCPCCGKERVRIGSESSWQIEYIPGYFQRVEHLRLRYGCAACSDARNNAGNGGCDCAANIDIAEKPAQPIDKGLPGPDLRSFIVTSKLADHTPLYRLEDTFPRRGFEISLATMSVWCGDVAQLLKPLYDRMAQRVLSGRLICTDDTTMPMLSPGYGKTKTARMWVYVGDHASPYDMFHFTKSRSRDGPTQFLRGFKGTLLADGYGGYVGVVVGNGLIRAGCRAHARRKFVDAGKSQPQIAREVVDLIGKLCDIDRRAKAWVTQIASRCGNANHGRSSTCCTRS